jgi:hypothetical protein
VSPAAASPSCRARPDAATASPKRQRVLAELERMERERDPITFAAVARAASVSTWLAYAEGVREHIDAAQKRQAAQPLRDQRAGLSASIDLQQLTKHWPSSVSPSLNCTTTNALTTCRRWASTS